jgi:hypothetical protein
MYLLTHMLLARKGGRAGGLPRRSLNSEFRF